VDYSQTLAVTLSPSPLFAGEGKDGGILPKRYALNS
jgi:hypothetical protein